MAHNCAHPGVGSRVRLCIYCGATRQQRAKQDRDLAAEKRQYNIDAGYLYRWQCSHRSQDPEPSRCPFCKAPRLRKPRVTRPPLTGRADMARVRDSDAT